MENKASPISKQTAPIVKAPDRTTASRPNRFLSPSVADDDTTINLPMQFDSMSVIFDLSLQVEMSNMYHRRFDVYNRGMSVGRAWGEDDEAHYIFSSPEMGQRLKKARLSRGMTLKSVADSTGCSESLISKIENGKAYPSLPTLDRLVRTLDTTMGWIFDGLNNEGPSILRANRLGASDEPRRALTIERVNPQSDDRKLECMIVHLDVGASSDGPYQHPGEETGYVLSGRVELSIDSYPHRLSEGDVFTFRAEQTHQYRNIGNTRASIFWVSTSKK